MCLTKTSTKNTLPIMPSVIHHSKKLWIQKLNSLWIGSSDDWCSRSSRGVMPAFHQQLCVLLSDYPPINGAKYSIFYLYCHIDGRPLCMFHWSTCTQNCNTWFILGLKFDFKDSLFCTLVKYLTIWIIKLTEQFEMQFKMSLNFLN